MKICLATIYQVPNYGSVLQAYATQKILEELGHKCEILNCNYPSNIRSRKSLKARIYDATLRLGFTAQQRKIRKLQVFKKERFNLSPKYSTYEQITKADWREYDCFVVGSDQVWNSKFTACDPIFHLSFAPKGKKKVSIASSFAADSIQDKYLATYREALSSFDALSVRESNGVSIIQKQLQLEKDVELVLDPTLLLNREEWLRNSEKSQSEEPFILLYMWTYAFEPRPCIYEVVQSLKEKYSINKVIVLEGFCNIDKMHRDSLQAECAEDSSIGEFLDLFNRASIVVTSSFHGTAFAINFSKPLISIVPDGGDDRQSTLLKSVKAETSIFRIGQDPHSANPYYNIAESQRILGELRKRSIDWLKNNI